MEDFELTLGELQDAVAETNERLKRIEKQQAALLKIFRKEDKPHGQK